jgi:hypothetical protein
VEACKLKTAENEMGSQLFAALEAKAKYDVAWTAGMILAKKQHAKILLAVIRRNSKPRRFE